MCWEKVNPDEDDDDIDVGLVPTSPHPCPPRSGLFTSIRGRRMVSDVHGTGRMVCVHGINDPMYSRQKRPRPLASITKHPSPPSIPFPEGVEVWADREMGMFARRDVDEQYWEVIPYTEPREYWRPRMWYRGMWVERGRGPAACEDSGVQDLARGEQYVDSEPDGEAPAEGDEEDLE